MNYDWTEFWRNNKASQLFHSAITHWSRASMMHVCMVHCIRANAFLNVCLDTRLPLTGQGKHEKKIRSNNSVKMQVICAVSFSSRCFCVCALLFCFDLFVSFCFLKAMDEWNVLATIVYIGCEINIIIISNKHISSVPKPQHECIETKTTPNRMQWQQNRKQKHQRKWARKNIRRDESKKRDRSKQYRVTLKWWNAKIEHGLHLFLSRTLVAALAMHFLPRTPRTQQNRLDGWVFVLCMCLPFCCTCNWLCTNLEKIFLWILFYLAF